MIRPVNKFKVGAKVYIKPEYSDKTDITDHEASIIGCTYDHKFKTYIYKLSFHTGPYTSTSDPASGMRPLEVIEAVLMSAADRIASTEPKITQSILDLYLK